MNSLASSSKKLNKNKLSHYLLEEEVIMNWSTLKKCILMLILACIIHIAWLGWDSFILLNPQYWQVVNLDIVRIQFVLNSIFFTDLVRTDLSLLCTTWSRLGAAFFALCRDRYFCHFSLPRQLFRWRIKSHDYDCLHLFTDRGLSPV